MAGRGKILFLFDNPVQDYVSRLQTHAARLTMAAGYKLQVENTYGTGLGAAGLLADPELVGVVLSPPYSDDRHTLTLIEAKRIPYVRIAPLLEPERGSSVMMDEYEAARAITDVMLSLGHRRIAIMRGPNSHLVSMRRYNGYANALGGKGLRVDQSLVARGDFSRESGRREAAQLFAAKPTAIFASNDEMAAGIIDAAQAAGIRIPEQISLVGYDDNPSARTMRPRLTTVRQPLEKMGESAFELLIEMLIRPGARFQTRVVPFEIMERESVMPPAAVA